jgi:hypothetical protein
MNFVICVISGKNASNASPNVSSSDCGGVLVDFLNPKSNGEVVVFA